MLVAPLLGSVAFTMSVDAGYLRDSAWAIPWIWGLSAALWLWWLISHPKIEKEWLKGFHEKVGKGIHPIRLALSLIVLLAVGFIITTVVRKPQTQAVGVANQQNTPANTTSPATVSPVIQTKVEPTEKSESHKKKPETKAALRETLPKQDTKTAAAPSVSTSAENSPAVGSVTQGPGSAFSVNQQGGATIGTVNVGFSLPKVSWVLTSAYAPLKEAKHPQVWVELSIDRIFVDAKFAVVCSRPCTAVYGSPKSPHGEVSQGDWGSIPNRPNVVVFVTNVPNPMPADTKYSGCIESNDDVPVEIVDVQPLTISKH
jgi:hypothetical protein